MKIIELDGEEAALVFQGDDVTIEFPCEISDIPDPVPTGMQTAIALYALMADDEFVKNAAGEWREMLDAQRRDK